VVSVSVSASVSVSVSANASDGGVVACRVISGLVGSNQIPSSNADEI
jgi:hypothetical protein